MGNINIEEKVKTAVNGDNRGLNRIIENVKGLNSQSIYGIYLMQSCNFASLPDVIDYCKYKSRRSLAGLLTVIQGFSIKFAVGINGFVLGQMLKYGGYVENQKQSAKVLSMMQIDFIWIPVVFCVLIIVLIIFYTLDKKLSQMQAELAKKREK